MLSREKYTPQSDIRREVFSHLDAVRQRNSVSVNMNKIRRKVRPHGIKILSIIGYGYKIVPASFRIGPNQQKLLNRIGLRGGVLVPPEMEADWQNMENKAVPLAERIRILGLTRLEEPLCAL